MFGGLEDYTYICTKFRSNMRINLFKKRAITKMLTLLGFSATAFVFAACYGAVPKRYMEESYSDSIRTVFEGEDTLTVDASDDRAADDLLRREDASRSLDNSGNTDN